MSKRFDLQAHEIGDVVHVQGTLSLPSKNFSNPSDVDSISFYIRNNNSTGRLNVDKNDPTVVNSDIRNACKAQLQALLVEAINDQHLGTSP